MVEKLHAHHPVEALKKALPIRFNAEEIQQLEHTIDTICHCYKEEITDTGQKKQDYVCSVARQIMDIKLDISALYAVLLSFMPLDTDKAKRDIEEQYGTETRLLLEEMQRINTVQDIMNKANPSRSAHYNEEVIRKMLMSLVKDIRVVVITIAMHSEHLRYLAAFPISDQHRRYANLGLSLYGPLANRLGIWQLKWPIEDLSFRFLDQERYLHIARQLQERRSIREAIIEEAIHKIKEEMCQEGIECTIQGRAKHIYSIHNKMCLKKLAFDQLYDLLAIRILVKDIKQCYATLGVVHNLWTPIPKEFDDYIHQPKSNLYQSLHTAVLFNHHPLEVQIRTYDMHEHAEMGVSAHWRYKERDTSGKLSQYNEKIALLRQLLMWQKDVQKAQSPASTAMIDGIIYVFTPQYDVIDMHSGSTPLDFAYRIHTTLGHRCRGAKVNGHIVPLNTTLHTMDQVDIITTKTGGPSRDWLDPEKGFLKSSKARTKVRHYFMQEAREETFASGKNTLQKELQRLGQTHNNHDDIAKKLHLDSAKALYIALYHQEIKSRDLAQLFSQTQEDIPTEPDLSKTIKRSENGETPVDIMGITGMLTQLSRCCHPAPGDDIMGFITKDRGITIHRTHCRQLKRLQEAHPERCMPANWRKYSDQSQASFEQVYLLRLETDSGSVIPQVVALLTREKIGISQMQTLHSGAKESIQLKIKIRYHYTLNIAHLLQKIQGVDSVIRQ